MFLTEPSHQARRRSQAIAVPHPIDAIHHVGSALVGSVLVGGGIWIALAHLLKALF